MKTKKKANQVKGLTKEELVKLYKDFRNEKVNLYTNTLIEYERSMMGKLRNELSEYRSFGYGLGAYYELPKKIKIEDFDKSYKMIWDSRPTWVEPTLSEFMEWLEGKGKKTKMIDISDQFWSTGVFEIDKKHLA